jgi:peptide-methionine (S)-S-oxide reductase
MSNNSLSPAPEPYRARAPVPLPGRARAAAPGQRLARCLGALLALPLLLTLAPGSHGAEKTAAFAGGCFWCVEADIEKLAGISNVVSGFTGGTLQNPTYRGNHEGHYEAVEVTFDDAVITYADLLRYFWRSIDPLDAGGQFCDRGFSYKTAVFVADEQQRAVAEASLAEVSALFPGQDIATLILPANRFWPVEDYHQDYAKKNPLRYKYYRWNCGRDQRVEELWGDKDWGLPAPPVADPRGASAY